MAFVQTEITFQPGLYGNRSGRASKARWIDGNHVRFRFGVPAQVGGWTAVMATGAAMGGRARDVLAWRPNNQLGRFMAIGTNSNAYLYDGESIRDITPAGFIAGRPDSIVGNGFGVGGYGNGFYGTPRTLTYNVVPAGGWTFDLFGEVLIGCGIGDGTIYEYTAGGASSVMTAIANAPKANAILVSDERHVFAFGSPANPNLVQWSDRENRTAWTPTAQNRAGSYDMQALTPFQCGKRVSGAVAAWTQTEAFLFEPLSSSLVYSQRRIGTNCGAMGPHAVAVVNDPAGDAAYWMAPHGFYVLDTTVRQLTCELQDYVFKDINLLQRAKVQARVNAAFGEVWFWYCSAAATEIDRAVIYSFETQTWSKSNVARLVWQDAGVFPLPLAIDGGGALFQHEDGDEAAGAPLGSYVVSSPLMVGVGQQFSEVSDFWPDMEASSGECALTVIGRDYPGGPDIPFGPYSFTPALEKIDLSISTRQIEIRIDGVAGYWELGAPLLNVQAGGGR